MLELEQVVAGYGPNTVLHGINLKIAEGEVVSFIGRNGMGKTTTVRSVIGLHPVRAGSIRFRGQEITTYEPEQTSRLGLACVPEGRHIFPTLTVLENLIMAQRKGYWTLDRIYTMFPRLKERRANMGNQLSGGEQQMVSIARALLLNPYLIILDEATEGLAPLVQDEIWNCLKDISETGMSILIIDKDIEALKRIASRHYTIQKGEIKWSGTTADMLLSKDILNNYLAL